MEDKELANFCHRKAFEISYAIVSLSSRLKQRSFAGHLENQALNLLEAVTAGDFAKARIAINSLSCLWRLATATGTANVANGELLASELGNLNSAIAELENAAKLPDFDLKNVFVSYREELILPNDIPETQAKKDLSLVDPASKSPLPDNPATVAVFLKSNKERQEFIIGRIREKGSCHLKDLQMSLPGSSERTIRYDLQNLTEQGVLRRVGSGGPATYYIILENH